jgi:phosphoribosylformylglycinamidine cyclo-ligase
MADKDKGEESQYSRLGVDAMKGSVRKVFGSLVDNDFPGAFVNIVRDPDRPGEVFTGHMDGDGSKFIQRVLMFRELGDPAIFRGAADDALSMNTGDIAAAGFISGLMTVTDILNVNGFNVPKQIIMEQIGDRLAELRELYRNRGFKMYFLGGETADLPHQVQTVAFDVNVHARALETDLILGNVQEGDHIWGFQSDGEAIWESDPNSGIMSNGLTLARMVTMDASYTKKYPDLVKQGGAYTGKFLVNFPLANMDDMTIGEALVSPTRQWAILIKILLGRLKEDNSLHLLHGITMNTGGGATKVLHLGKGGILYRKQMPPPPSIFSLVQSESGEAWRDMYQNFNCGVGIDIVGDPKLQRYLVWAQQATNVKVCHLGECYSWGGKENKVDLLTPFGSFEY